MRSSRFRLLRCPFCPPGRGVVAAAPSRIPPATEVTRGPDDPAGSFLCFVRGEAPRRPCSHLVHLESQAARAEDSPNQGGVEEGYGSISYRHPALVAADPDCSVILHVWEVLSSRPSTGPRPGTPFRFRQEDIDGEVVCPNGHSCGEWWVTADALYAADVPRFVRECVALTVGAFPRSGCHDV